MTIWQLEVFKAVVELGSLQAAAGKLHRTAPALSMTLQKLEAELDFALFDRDGYRLTLTPRGQQFMRHSYELLRQHERLQSLTKQLQSEAEPELNIAFDYTCHPGLLTPALSQVQQSFPGTELLISGYSQLGALKLVQDNRVPLALSPWLPVFQQRADFESLFVANLELVVAMASHLIPSGHAHSRELLNNTPYILPRQLDMGINPEQIYRTGGTSRTRVNDVQTLSAFIKAGMGWGIVPRQLIADEVSKGRVTELDIPGFLDRVNAEIHLVKLAGSVLGPAGQVVWEYFRQFDSANHN